MKITINSIEEMPKVVEEVYYAANRFKIWVLDGEMGAGKTTFVKYLCRFLKIKDKVSSPTFSLVNEYRTPKGDSVFHFDFYRMKVPEEALDIGVDEYFDSGALCLIEWAEKLGPYLPDEYIKISISVSEDQARTFKI